MVEAVRKYLKPITNNVVKRHKFFNMRQLISETIQEFLVRLKIQASNCTFDDKIEYIENQRSVYPRLNFTKNSGMSFKGN